MGRAWALAQRLWRSHWGTALLLLAVVLGVQAWQTRAVPAGLAPDALLQVTDAQGQTQSLRLSDWRAAHPGRPVALHVWAEWCPICRAEEHSIDRLAQSHPVLTVALRSGPPAQVARVMRQRGLDWQAAADPQGQFTDALGFAAVPAFVVIDRHGQLRLPSVGYTTEIGMRARLWWARWF